jgi:hypothetical protein
MLIFFSGLTGESGRALDKFVAGECWFSSGYVFGIQLAVLESKF